MTQSLQPLQFGNVGTSAMANRARNDSASWLHSMESARAQKAGNTLAAYEHMDNANHYFAKSRKATKSAPAIITKATSPKTKGLDL